MHIFIKSISIFFSLKKLNQCNYLGIMFSRHLEMKSKCLSRHNRTRYLQTRHIVNEYSFSTEGFNEFLKYSINSRQPTPGSWYPFIFYRRVSRADKLPSTTGFTAAQSSASCPGARKKRMVWFLKTVSRSKDTRGVYYKVPMRLILF